MISITIKSTTKLNNVLNANSAYISFNYNPLIVEYIKALPAFNRAYSVSDKCWEVSVDKVAEFCNHFTQFDIEIIEEIAQKENITDSIIQLPNNFEYKTKPFKHQEDGVKFAWATNKFLLCDEQGLGKTKQMIDWVSCLIADKKIKRALIICCVNSLKYNWHNEINTHSKEKAWVLGTRFRKNGNQYEGSGKDKLDDLNNLPNCKFIITNIETLRGGAHKVKNRYQFPVAEKIQELIDKGEISCIIADEVHKSCNPTSLQSRALLKTSCDYMAGLTGTPIMNRVIDLYPYLYWLGFEKHSFYNFKNHYCVLGGFAGNDVVGYKNLEEIRQVLNKKMLRRLKSEVLDLPEKLYTDEYVEMGTKQAKLYNEVLNGIKSELHRISFSENPLAMLIKLRQATGHTSILTDNLSESAKMDRMLELVEEITSSDGKCIIFSNWEQMTTRAKELLSVYKPAYITGSINTNDRMKEVERFQNDNSCKVIIGTMGAMGTGLTLTAAQTVIFLDEPWTAAIKSQCEDRAHRIGTTGTVNIITLLTKNTIDEKIHNIVFKKGLLSDIMIDGKMGKIDMKIINELIS